jgi:hypothetical protein
MYSASFRLAEIPSDGRLDDESPQHSIAFLHICLSWMFREEPDWTIAANRVWSLIAGGMMLLALLA